LNKLTLSENPLKNDSAEFLCQMFGKLAVLDLAYTGIDSGGATRLALGLTEWGSELRLTELNLSGNLIGDKGAVALALAMGGCSTMSLRIVELRCCSIRDEGAKALAMHVIGNLACSVRDLDLENNLFLPAGLLAISDALKETALVYLDAFCEWDAGWEGDEEELQEFYDLNVQVHEEFDRIKLLRPFYVMLSPRNGSKSAIRKLPSEVIRMVAAMFFE
jgi:hypothetical protein